MTNKTITTQRTTYKMVINFEIDYVFSTIKLCDGPFEKEKAVSAIKNVKEPNSKHTCLRISVEPNSIRPTLNSHPLTSILDIWSMIQVD